MSSNVRRPLVSTAHEVGTLTVVALAIAVLLHHRNVLFLDGFLETRQRALVVVLEMLFDEVLDVQVGGVPAYRVTSVCEHPGNSGIRVCVMDIRVWVWKAVW